VSCKASFRYNGTYVFAGDHHGEESHVACIIPDHQEGCFLCKLRKLLFDVFVNFGLVVNVRNKVLSIGAFFSRGQCAPDVVLQRRNCSRSFREFNP